MAHQDYVSRSKPTKKNNPYKKTSTEQPSKFPAKFKLLAGFVCIALLGFGYFLVQLNKVEPTVEPLALPSTKSSTKTALPEPPKEKWRYMEELKSKEVEVGQYEVKEKGPWKMQCGSFRTRKQAEVMKANIAFAGLSSQISEATGSSGTWHKVFLGPYPKKRDAEKDKHKLRNNNINTCAIWLWN